MTPQSTAQDDTSIGLPCPNNCGAVLTGVHAGGNMTRHLKSQACLGSNKAMGKHVCPYKGCGRVYTRSDGLKVHLRRRHGAPPADVRFENPPIKEEYGMEV